MYMRKYEENINRKDHEQIVVPPIIKMKENLPYQLKIRANLEKDGIVRVGSYVEDGNIYVNKQVLKDTKSYHAQEYVDKPARYDGELPSYVDKVVLSSTDEDFCRVKMIARQT